jgi:hypothetical protein
MKCNLNKIILSEEDLSFLCFQKLGSFYRICDAISLSSSWVLQPRVGLGLLKTMPQSGMVKGDIFPVSNTDVVEIFFKPINPSQLGSSTSSTESSSNDALELLRP